MENTLKRYKTIHLIAGGAVVALPVVLLLLPANFFDAGQSLCLSVLLLETECYGCGMTRAIMHLMHGNFAIAWNFNPLAYLVFPLLAMLWIKLTAYYLFQKTILNWF